VRIVQGLVELVPSGDWVTAFQDEEGLAQLRTYLEEVGTSELEIEGMVAGQGGFGPPASGAEALVEFWREWLTPWESFTLEVGQILEGSNGVLLEVVQRGRLQGSSAVVESASAAVHYFRGGRLARIEFHIERDKAREAAGVS
jgi:hypothetical protein